MQVRLKIDSINELIQFWTICESSQDDIFVKQNGRIMDAKSILGLCSLNLLQPFEIRTLQEELYPHIKHWEYPLNEKD